MKWVNYDAFTFTSYWSLYATTGECLGSVWKTEGENSWGCVPTKGWKTIWFPTESQAKTWLEDYSLGRLICNG